MSYGAPLTSECNFLICILDEYQLAFVKNVSGISVPVRPRGLGVLILLCGRFLWVNRKPQHREGITASLRYLVFWKKLSWLGKQKQRDLWAVLVDFSFIQDNFKLVL